VNTDDYKDNNSVNILSKVDKLIQQARIDHEKGAYRQAFINLQIAEKLLYRIIDLKNSDKNLSEREIKAELFSSKRYIDSIEEKIRIDGTPSQISLLKKAGQFLISAERDASLGNLRQAKKKISLAQKMATKALQLQLLTNTNDSNLITKRLTEVTRLLRLQEKRMGNQDEPSLQFLHNEAKLMLEKADRLSQSGNSSAAFFNIQIALRFINRIERLLDKKENKIDSNQQILNTLNELDKKLYRISPENNPEKMTVLRNLLSKARNSYNSGQYEIAAELVFTVKNQMQFLSH
jgi:HEPN domain-containing protein